MVTSLAATTTTTTSGRILVACGTESGSVIVRDVSTGKTTATTKIGRHPVLCLDATRRRGAPLFLAGAAADRDDDADADSGGAAAALVSPRDEVVRRLPACTRGVGCCRFRDDGRLLAVGGWDHRARVYAAPSSSSSSIREPLAVLRGHGAGSVTALDWGTGRARSLLVTGGKDGNLCLWNASFARRTRKTESERRRARDGGL